MSDNVVRFRRNEKQPEPPPRRPRGPAPSWVWFAALVGLAVVIYLLQRAGVL
jgi:hypothetical protein